MTSKIRLISVLLIVCIGLSVINITFAEEQIIPSSDFEITELYVRSGENGAYDAGWYQFRNSGLDAGKKPFSDRANQFCEIPDKFVDAAYIITKRADTSKPYFLDGKTYDWLKFDINQSATVYIIDYYNGETTPQWLTDNGWKTEKDNSVKWSVTTVLETTVYESYYIHSKHFDVSEGGKTTVTAGGYDGKTYNSYSVFIVPDNKRGDGLIRLSADDMSKENWEGEIASPIGDALIMFDGSSVIYNNGIKDKIKCADSNVAPYKDEEDVMLPLRFISEHFGGEVKYDASTSSVVFTLGDNEIYVKNGSSDAKVNGESYKLNKPVKIKNNSTYISSDILKKVLNKNVESYEKGLITITDKKVNPDASVVARLTALYLTPVMGVAARMKYASPGDEIVIPDGTYSDVYLIMEGKGTEEKPITVRAQTPGGVIITGYPEIVITGEHIVFKDFYFVEANSSTQIIYLHKASYCRITECYFYKTGSDTNSGYRIISLGAYSHHNRVDHNAFERNTAQGVMIYAPDSVSANEISRYNRVDHNYFKDVRKCTEEHPNFPNGMECVQVGTSALGRSAYTTVEYNLFEECYGDGNEIISNKTSDNVYRYNTFLNNNYSGATVRTGNRTVWDRNYFINGSTGIQVYGKDHIVTNNYFYNLSGEALNLPTGDYNKQNENYKQCVNVIIANNTFINPKNKGILLGYGLNSQTKYTYVPENTRIYNNLFITESDKINMIEDRNSLNTEYKNNIFSLHNIGKIGIEKNDGIIEEEINLSATGNLYMPDDFSKLSGKGIFTEEVYNVDEFAKSLGDKNYDIGVNKISDAKSKMVTLKDVGPTKRWWVELLRSKPADINETEPENTPERYVPSKNKAYVNINGALELNSLNGNAFYENGRSYKVSSKDVVYEIVEGEGFSVEGNLLKAEKTETGKIKATYKGCSALIDVYAVREASEEYTEDFSTDRFFENAQQNGKWEVSDGKLKNINPSKTFEMIVDNSRYYKDDWRMSFDMTLKENGNTGVYTLDGFVVLGYKDSGMTEYMRVGFGGENFYQVGIYKKDGYYLDEKIGEIKKRFAKDRAYNVSILKKGDILTVTVDNELAAVLKTDFSFDGRIGFGSSRNEIEVDNLTVSDVKGAEYSGNKKTLDITSERSDLYETSLTIENPCDEEVIYRIYRNGVWLYDFTDDMYKDNTMQRDENSYNYEIIAIDSEGNEIAEGNTLIELSDTPDDMFFISDVRYRTGPDNTFDEVMYRPNNKGLDKGAAAKQWVFFDLYYPYTTLDDKFIGAAYIKGVSNFKNNVLAVSKDTSEWMKFNLNNKSATVYVVFYNPGNTVPDWIYNDDWTQTHHVMKVSTTKDVVVATSSHVFKKHFNVESGNPVTVTLGGFGCIPNYSYSVIVVPD